MKYKNGVIILINDIIVEIPCDRKVYINNQLLPDEKNKSIGNLEYDSQTDQMKLIIGNNMFTLSKTVIQSLPNNENIKFIHFINESIFYDTQFCSAINIINNSSAQKIKNSIRLNVPDNIYIDIEGSELFNISRTPIYINGILNRESVVNLNEGDFLFLYGLKFTYYKEKILVEGNRALYSTDILECDDAEKEFEGFLKFERAPRIIKRVPEDVVKIKMPPSKVNMNSKKLAFIIASPLMMMAVTIIMGILLKRGSYIFMSLGMTCVTLIISIITYFNNRKDIKIKNQKRTEVYNKYLLSLRERLNELSEQQKEALNYKNPSLKNIEMICTHYTSRIYERISTDSDFLEVSVGSIDVPPTYKVEFPEDQIEIETDEFKEEAKSIAKEFSIIKDVPFTINLRNSTLGIVGEKKYIHEQLNLLFTQLATFHSYHDLEIILISNEQSKKDFEWLRWYPHFKISSINVRGIIDNETARDQVLGNLVKILKDRETMLQEKETVFLLNYLFVIDDLSLVLNHPIMEFLKGDRKELGIVKIFTSEFQDNLPENVKTIISIDNYETGTLISNDGVYENKKIKLNHIDIELENISRRISALNHVKSKFNQIPESITFFEMYNINSPEELNITERWEKNRAYKSLAVPLGVRAKNDYVYLNLHEKAHGPHGLVAGTTGSGKSEIIQSYILSLAVNFNPYEVGFLLIDYKGGGMAGLFDNLPHLLGTITNLDGSGSMRAMASIKSELERRQRIFNENNVNNITQYSKLFWSGKAKEPLPHLFLISDEFAELKKEQPEFMKELVSTARIGRSLGVHLILATQKPTGVVDDQIWSNSKFKLALKVQNESDSKEILKTTDAAQITQPGRAYLQVGNNEIYELFQSAFSGASYSKEKEVEEVKDNRIYLINNLGQGELLNQDLSQKEDDIKVKETELDVCINYIHDYYDGCEKIEVKKPWLPPLSANIPSPHINEYDIEDVSIFNELDAEAAIGVVDIPERQEQKEYKINFVKEGNLAIFSSSGFGKTTSIINIILSLAVKNSPLNAQFFLADLGNAGLIPLRNLPHVRDYIKGDEKTKFEKLKKLIGEELKIRKKKLEEMSVANFHLYNEISREKMPAIFVIFDNIDALAELDDFGNDFIKKISRDGISVGIFVIAAASRENAFRMGVINNFKNRFAHYMFEENEIRSIVGRSQYKIPDVPGRAMVKTDDIHVMQTYAPISAKNEVEYNKKLIRLIEIIKDRYTGEALEGIRMLPDTFELKHLVAYDKNKDLRRIAIGLDKEDVLTQYIELNGTVKLIIGGPQTGKTNILKAVIKQKKERTLFVIDSKNSDLFALRHEVDLYAQCDQKEVYKILKELVLLTEKRKAMFAEAKAENPELTPKMFYSSLPVITVLIDNIDEFIGCIEESKKKIAKSTFEEAMMVGVTVIGTVLPVGLKGADPASRMFKNSAYAIITDCPNDQRVLSMYVTKAVIPPIEFAYVYDKGRTIIIKIPKIK